MALDFGGSTYPVTVISARWLGTATGGGSWLAFAGEHAEDLCVPPVECHGNLAEAIRFFAREGLEWGHGSDPCKAVEDLARARMSGATTEERLASTRQLLDAPILDRLLEWSERRDDSGEPVLVTADDVVARMVTLLEEARAARTPR